MTHKPRTVDSIYGDIRDRLSNRITKLTNFTERSFNFVWTRAFSRDLREVELRALATELSGFIDYAGGPIDRRDLEQLGIEDVVEPEEINPYMNDEDLDELVKLVGITRFEGTKATGTVTIDANLNSKTSVPSGTVVTTAPDSAAETIDFETVNDVTIPVGTTTVTDIDIQAVDVGDEFNVPAGTIVRFSEPPLGVTGVNNPSSTTGGEGREQNDELRERAKAAIAEQSGGGTVLGIEGFIRTNLGPVGQGDVIVDEFPSPCPPYSDVIVDGGTDEEVLDAIERSRPAAITHNLIRPSEVQVEVDAVLNGTDINVSRTKENIEEFLLELSLADNFYKDELIRVIMRSDRDIINIEQLDVYIQRVAGERFEYDGSSTYSLTYTHDGGDVEIADEDGNLFDEPADYEIKDTTGDGLGDTVDWSGGDTPQNGNPFFVDYDVNDELEIVRHEENVLSSINDSFTYETVTRDYTLSEVPIEQSVEVKDSNDNSLSSYTIENTLGAEKTQTFTFESGRKEYPLDFQTDASSVTIPDTGGNSFIRGTDYTVQDKTGDGLDDTIVWDLDETNPNDGEQFTVTFNVDNGIPQTLRWDTSGTTPDDGESFTVLYQQKYHPLEYDVVRSLNGQILDQDGTTTYAEGTDWNFADYSGDRESDGIVWLNWPPGPGVDDSFFISYINEGNRTVTIRDKIGPGDISISVK